MAGYSSEKRWLVALNVEKTWNNSRQIIEERIKERRVIWAKLLKAINEVVNFHSSTKTLDIGAETTSIFLALREGEKYALDPLFSYLFKLHPFLLQITEYRDVHFISSTLEELNESSKFDVIFSLAMLDHIGTLDNFTAKIDKILNQHGFLVVMVDCHADPWVRNLMNYFDIELYHPHHFISEDIVELFSKYRLMKHLQVFHFYEDCPSGRQSEEMKIYRIDRFIKRMSGLLKEWQKDKDIWFMSKFFVCYGLVYFLSIFRRKDNPIHPLKKPNIFVFQKS